MLRDIYTLACVLAAERFDIGQAQIKHSVEGAAIKVVVVVFDGEGQAKKESHTDEREDYR